MNLLLILLVSLLSCAAQLCQKQAAHCGGHRLFGWLVLSLLLLGTAMLLWLVVLRTVPVSVAYPMLSPNFVLVAVAARIWRETYAAAVAGYAGDRCRGCADGEPSVKGWLALASVLLSLAQLLLRTAMLALPPLDTWTALPWQHGLIPLIGGLAAYGCSMLCWLLALRLLPLNRLYPLLSLSYVLCGWPPFPCQPCMKPSAGAVSLASY